MKTIRCAIYTRKSSDEGLDQAFNSLDAQREACAAYILSQASEGWTSLPDIYDDGGLSGGSLERPALQRLLADVAAGRVDIIVVYKVDRLTRSLLDFAKLVEAFDKAGVSFVSITQSFNTTTSMGRLTLNMLLSFAQFEREVTAERIRDKIAASKAKGMWMGGIPPLGYEPDGRSLKIVPEHAEIVRDIYSRYLAVGNVRLVAEQLEREGRRLPLRTTTTGKPFGGGLFMKGQLYTILKSPIYVGDIPHQSKVYPGLHEPIIDRDTWNHTQAKLAEGVRGTRGPRPPAEVSLLAGKIVDANGARLIASHACKGARRYRYYISASSPAGSVGVELRIPAIELEAAVAGTVAVLLDDPLGLAAQAGLEIETSRLSNLMERAWRHAVAVRKRDPISRPLVRLVRILDRRIEIEVDVLAIAEALGLEANADMPTSITLDAPVRLTRSGRAVRLVQETGAKVATAPDASLVGLLIKARRWWSQLGTEGVDVTRLAAEHRVSPSYMTRVVRLAFLAPEVVDAIINGGLKAGIDGTALTLRERFAPEWTRQIEDLLPAK
jgi:DNA invertase Pin-like site-specific DNA recombinase